ncbi:MAG: exopolyphosphatase [Flavobacteriales bacterium]|nr:exopolyphosphatase [Flavobacteriales bacterium]
MKFAAIDIGSNAVRLLIEEAVPGKKSFEIHKISLNRVPIRLGEDVFTKGKISEKKKVQLVKAMKAFWYLMDVHDIENYRACATSAMREASNGEQIIKYILKKANIRIDTIDGDQEADIIFSNFKRQHIDLTGNYLYIDVGGGSTEVTLIKHGERVTSKSFRIGTVRMLKEKVSKKHWVAARHWIQELASKEDHLIGIGTGGNINRIFKEAGKKSYERITSEEIEHVYEFIGSFSFRDRITKLGLKPDRADVILPAAEIYYNFMRFADVEELIVPRIGLADGMILGMVEDWMSSR